MNECGSLPHAVCLQHLTIASILDAMCRNTHSAYLSIWSGVGDLSVSATSQFNPFTHMDISSSDVAEEKTYFAKYYEIFFSFLFSPIKVFSFSQSRRCLD